MTAVSLPAADYFNGSITNANAKDAQDDILAFLRQSVLGCSTESTLTISSGSITPTSTTHAVETESSASTDDLTNIAVTNMADGQTLTLRCLDATHVVTLKHQAGGTGQLNLWKGVDTRLNDLNKYITFRRNGSNWDETDRSWEDRVVKSKNSNYTVVAGDDASVIKVDASSGNVTITMTAAATLKSDFRVTIERSDSHTSNTVTIARSGSDTFQGVDTSLKLTQANHAFTLSSDGVSDFRVMSRGTPGMDVWCGASGGTANAMTFTPIEPVRALYTGLKVRGTVTTVNTSKTMTLAVSGLTSKAVKKRINNSIVEIGVGENIGYQEYVYDGTQWIMEVPRGSSQAADIASASTISFDAATGNWGHITGTTTISTITMIQGSRFRAIFDGALQLTNGASLINITGANITTAAGDSAEFVGEASGVVRMVSYSRANGQALASSGWLRRTVYTSGSGTWTRGTGTTKIHVQLWGGGGGTSGNGGTTTFDSLSATGGENANGSAPITGGIGSGGTRNLRGQSAAIGNASQIGGFGGAAAGGGGCGGANSENGQAPGGGAGTAGGNAYGGAGGGFCEDIYTAPSSASYSVGAGGTGTWVGGAGEIVVDEYA